MNTLKNNWPDRQASNSFLPWNLIALVISLGVFSSTLFAGEKLANTVRDRLWTWAVDASYDWPAHEAGAAPQKNRMTPVEGAVYLGTPNVMFIQYNGVPVAPFQQYYTPFKSLKQVYWTLSNNGNQIHELGPEQEHVYELATDNPNITGLLLDDFLIGPIPEKVDSQWLSNNSPTFPVTLEVQFTQAVLADSLWLTQSDWAAGGYRTAKFAVDASTDGATWQEVATGELPDDGGASKTIHFPPQSLSRVRIRVLSSHDSEAPLGCGLKSLALFHQDQPHALADVKFVTNSEYLGHDAAKLIHSKFTKKQPAKQFQSQVSPSNLATAKQRMQRIDGRKLDLAVVVYTNQIDPGIVPILQDVDVVLLWTWKSSDLKHLEANFRRLQNILPGKRVILGCYLWDFSNAQVIPLDVMQKQCELGLSWLKAGEIEGMIFCCNNIMDKDLKAVEWTRQWITRVGHESLITIK